MSSKSFKFIASLLLASAIALPAIANANEVIYRYKSELVTVTGGTTSGTTPGTGTDGSTGTGSTDTGGTDTGGTGGSTGGGTGGGTGTSVVSADPDAGKDSLACGSSTDGTGPLGCVSFTDQSGKPAASQLSVTMIRAPSSYGTANVTRCFTVAGGNGNFTVSSFFWGSTEWVDHVEVQPVDLPQLPTELPSYNLTASYPSNRAFPDRVTGGRSYCAVVYVTKDASQIEDPVQPGDDMGGVIDIADYDPADMVGDRHNVYANAANYIDINVDILGAEVIPKLPH